jgi:hypothetical protein
MNDEQWVAHGTIASLTPTLSALLGTEPPELSSSTPLEAVVRGRAGDRTRPVSRCLVYCPDALGDHVWGRFPERRDRVEACCPRRVPLLSVVPPKTPVCFASLFTGTSPERHGVRRPDRSVLRCDTFFDAAARAGKRVAIAAVTGSSLDLMFRHRRVDYFSEPHDAEATGRALELIGNDRHDVIVLYNQEYDDQLHATEPFSPECVQALENHVSTVERLASAVDAAWEAHARVMVVAPDHGAHLDPSTGAGTHGLDIPEDMRVSHWYGIRPGA